MLGFCSAMDVPLLYKNSPPRNSPSIGSLLRAFFQKLSSPGAYSLEEVITGAKCANGKDYKEEELQGAVNRGLKTLEAEHKYHEKRDMKYKPKPEEKLPPNQDYYYEYINVYISFDSVVFTREGKLMNVVYFYEMESFQCQLTKSERRIERIS
ncbi:hypothetical protein OnM2_001037 [Erysiphe neolycopersici]|uniref:Uncharacterized protein n=1 Tax=Erysiphe neolycopersici TaxID=212602 RepID=A0A420I878_9PEZI|nr:hypothetical protein OnM2_001037 [Erysiphe neolycopersici]